ncbi:MAG: glycine zipper 2TM domain-containing protein [Alphaproteobacteria bacterium]|nr:glycine zipper 2TM domain-containing protein [Alphaproteobacteria bacterium]
MVVAVCILMFAIQNLFIPAARKSAAKIRACNFVRVRSIAMSKILLSTTAACVLILGGVAPASAGDVYGHYDQYDPDAPYQGGGDGYYADSYRGDTYRYHNSGSAYNGCQDRELVGTGLGAILGGVIGNQFGHHSGRTAATIGGVILGGIAGNVIARDGCGNRRADAHYYNRAYYDGFEDPEWGRRYRWRNPYNGHYGYMQPVRDYDRGDRYGYDGECREFRQTIYIEGRRTTGYGAACRNRDGTWQIVGR